MSLITRVSQRSDLLLLGLALALSLGTHCTQAALVRRGPYLQQGTTNSMVIRWRTDVATDSLVRYGLTPDNLAAVASDSAVLTEHIVLVSGLETDTAYFYQIGTSTSWFAAGTNNFFTTAPLVGVPRPTRIWAVGDAGTGSGEQVAVRDGYTAYAGSRHTDLWLMLGDNAYDTGLDSEFQTAVFNMYPAYLQNTTLWPTLGNHDASSLSTNGVNPYFDIFTLPQNGEAGGLASGTEHYYSFDYANIHFICLDSAGSDMSSNGPMCNWLGADLAATTQDWLIAFWHHPPYTKGSHDSDADSNLIEVRQNIVPILENYGVDLALCGHSHSYERSFLLDGHYGLSSTLTAPMKIDGGDGRVDGSGAYQKPAGATAHKGAVYTVAGSSGQTGGGPLTHPAMFISLDSLGSVVLDIDGNRLDLTFVETNAVVGDHFTILKAPASTNAPAAPTNVVATAVSSGRIDLTWADASDNEAGFKLDRSTNGVDFSPIGVAGARVTNKTDVGLASSTTYYYRIRAFNAAGDSPFSDLAQATTLTITTDTVPPAAVTNLAVTGVTSTSAALAWTAPGGDGNIGIAARYDVRYSAALISDSNWASAAQATGEPAPAVASTSQSFTVTGLVSGTTYYFALKTADETNNLSPLSNVPQAATLTNSLPDTDAPAAVTNLVVASAALNTVSLRWTAPGDNGNVGTAAFYDVRYSTSPITAANWPFASQAVGEPDPGAPGTVQSFTVSGLAPGITYYFALKTADGTGNISLLSNVPNSATPPTLNPPTAPTALRATSVATNEIDLVWTDNANNEDGFKIERSGDGVNFNQLTTTGVNITNLSDLTVQPGSFNYYRVRAYNAGGNSPYSNTNGAQATSPGGSTVTTLIASNALWKYLDNGSNQSNSWTSVAFNDTGWASGPAILGYAGGHESTPVSYGPSASAKYITTYFRRHFNVSDPSTIIALTASLLRDDGGVVYVNGLEVFRSNMPTGAVNYLSPAPMSVVAPDKTLFHDSPPIDPGLIVPGDNVVAVEIHQHNGTSTAMDFALQLISTNRLTSTTVTTLSSSPNPSFAGDPITLTASVTNSRNGGAVTLGTVTFMEGDAILAGPMALNGAGQASVTRNGLGEGGHTIIATYGGSPGRFSASLGAETLNLCFKLAQTPLADQTACEGATARFTSASIGSAPVSVVWRRAGMILTNGVSLAGRVLMTGDAQAGTLAIVDVRPADADTYTVEVTDGCGNTTASSAMLSVVALPAPPSITLSPANPCPNSSGNGASGPPAATTYCWGITNGVITGATNVQTVTYTAGASGNVGLTLKVSNASGCMAASSTNAPLLVGTTLSCSTNITVTTTGNCPAMVSFILSGGDNCSSVAAYPPSGSAFPVGTNTVTVTATDAGGNTNACAFQVIVLPGTGPRLEPLVDQAACQGSTASFTNASAGRSPFNLVWKKGATVLTNGVSLNGRVSITGSNSVETLSIANLQDTDGDTYSVEVTDACGATAISAASLTVNPLPATPTIGLSPGNLCPNSTGNQASGPAGAITYLWSITNGTITSAADIQTINYVAGGSGDVGLTLRLSNAPGCVEASSTNVSIVTDRALACPADIILTATGICPAVVNFALPAGGACFLSNVVVNPPSGSLFPVGTNTVTVTGSDVAGTTNSCGFQVVVLPGPAPRVSIAGVGTNLVLSWADGFGCYTLHFAPGLLAAPATNVWNVFPGPFWTNGGSIFATNSAWTSNLFYRLAY